MTTAFACMATHPPRLGVLPRALDSLIGQFDRIFVYLNGFDEVPKVCTGREEVTPILGSAGDLGVNGRHYVATKLIDQEIHRGAMICTVDDDILYPPDYRKRMEGFLDLFGGVVSVHRARFLPRRPIRSYLKGREVFSFRRELKDPQRIHVPGVGTVAYRLGTIDLDLQRDLPARNMDDPQFAVACERQGIPRTVVPHSARWLLPLDAYGPAIADRCARDDRPWTEIVRRVDWAPL